VRFITFGYKYNTSDGGAEIHLVQFVDAVYCRILAWYRQIKGQAFTI